MTLRDKAFLVWHYGKAQLIIGGVYNILCTQLLLHRVSYAFFVNVFIIKAVVYAITYYLVTHFRKKDGVFFYINLGLSDRKLQLSVLLVDFLALALMLTVVLLVRG